VQAAPGSPQPTGLDVNSCITLRMPPQMADGDMCVAVLGPRENAATLPPYLLGRLDVAGNTVVGREALALPIDPVQTFTSRTSRYLALRIYAWVGLQGRVPEAARRMRSR